MKNYKRHLLIIILSLIMTINGWGQQQEKLRIAILDFTNTGGLSKQETVTLGNRLRSMLVKTNTFIVLERGQMDDILGEQGFLQAGCTTTECAVEMGRLLNVQKMISGTIGKLGKTYTIDLSLIDVQTGEIEKSFFRDFKGEIDGLLDLMQLIATQIATIVGGAGLPEVKSDGKIVNLEINSDPEGATIFINGNQVGKTPFESKAKEGLSITVRIEKENYTTWEKTISISADEEVDVELEYTDAYKQALAAADAEGGGSVWWWIGGGAIVAGGAAVLIMSGSSTGESSDPVTEDTGFPGPPARP